MIGKEERAETTRAFVALDLGEEARRALRELVDTAQKIAEAHRVHGSWAREPHLTLAFLGRVPSADLPMVADRMRQACSPAMPIFLNLSGMGGYPSLSRPRVVWVGVHGEKNKLLELQSRIARALREIGSHFERRPYSPHITIGRIKNAESGKGMMDDLDREIGAGSISCLCREVQLIRSELSPKGARYTTLESVTLEG